MARQNGTVDRWGERWRKDGWPDEITVSAAYGDHLDATKDWKCWVVLPEHPGWLFWLTFSPTGAMVGFEVVASFDNGRQGHSSAAPGLTARFVRSLPMGRIEGAARQHQAAEVAWLGPESPDYLEEILERQKQAFREDPRPGRRGRGDVYYAQMAAAYVGMCNSGEPSPVGRLAEMVHKSKSQVRNILYAARKRDLLTDAPAGRRGGELTPKARALLEEDKQ